MSLTWENAVVEDVDHGDTRAHGRGSCPDGRPWSAKTLVSQVASPAYGRTCVVTTVQVQTDPVRQRTVGSTSSGSSGPDTASTRRFAAPSFAFSAFNAGFLASVRRSQAPAPQRETPVPPGARVNAPATHLRNPTPQDHPRPPSAATTTHQDVNSYTVPVDRDPTLLDHVHCITTACRVCCRPRPATRLGARGRALAGDGPKAVLQHEGFAST